MEILGLWKKWRWTIEKKRIIDEIPGLISKTGTGSTVMETVTQSAYHSAIESNSISPDVRAAITLIIISPDSTFLSHKSGVNPQDIGAIHTSIDVILADKRYDIGAVIIRILNIIIYGYGFSIIDTIVRYMRGYDSQSCGIYSPLDPNMIIEKD